MTQVKAMQEAAAIEMWKGVAEQQLKERVRAEVKNESLRVLLDVQLKMTAELGKLMHTSTRLKDEKNMIKVEEAKRRDIGLDTTTDDEIFADQLTHVERAHLDVAQVFGRREFADRTASFYDSQMTMEPTSDAGVALVTKATSILPFDLQTTQRAMWRAFAEEGPKTMSYFNHERIVTENLAARSFGFKYDAASLQMNVRVKQTYRKCVDDDCIIIMWKSRLETVQMNGMKFCGLLCTQIGWMALRGVNLASENAQTGDTVADMGAMMSTSLQSYSTMTLEGEDGTADRELQVDARTKFVVSLHNVIAEVCGKMMKQALVDEWHDSILL